MLLQALFELSQQQHLVPDFGYVLGPYHYVMRISRDGKLLSLDATTDRPMMLLPQGKKRSSDLTPGYFVDKSMYVFGMGGEPKDTKEKEAKRLARRNECFQAFYRQVSMVAAKTQDDAALAYSRFLERLLSWQTGDQTLMAYADLMKIRDIAPELASEDYPDGWTGSEVILAYLEDEQIPMFQRPALREEWSQIQLAEETGRLGRCLVTGKIAPVLDKHYVIKGLPGAQASGALLCCYDKPAFTSRDAEQGENACISREGAVGYAAALNWMLERTESPKRRHRSGIQVGNDTVMLVWSSASSQFNPDSIVETLSPPVDLSPEAVLSYPASAWSGLKPSNMDSEKFFALLISPNASRVVVRDFIDLFVGKIKENVLQYHEDIKIGENPKPISLWLIHRALNVQIPRDAKKGGTQLPSILTAGLMRAIFKGTPYPAALLPMALRRLADPSITGRLRETCCAIVKAVLLRMPGQRKEITVSLDENNTEMAYLLGRLFAVLERLQSVAIPGVEASIRDRRLSAAFHAPANTYPSLLALSAHHHSKSVKKRRWSGQWLENLKIKIISQMPTSFPIRLMPVEQAQWHLGYYHQMAVLNAPRPANPQVE